MEGSLRCIDAEEMRDEEFYERSVILYNALMLASEPELLPQSVEWIQCGGAALGLKCTKDVVCRRFILHFSGVFDY